MFREYEIYCNVCKKWVMIKNADIKMSRKAEFKANYIIDCGHTIKVRGKDESWKSLADELKGVVK